MTGPVLLLGDPRLRRVAQPVRDFADPDLQGDARHLADALRAFRAAHGFGRAIAAPQLGIDRRLIALDRGDGAGPRLLANPIVTWTSDDTFTLWDDCMSFPSLLVRVRRASSLSLRFQDENGAPHAWERVDRALSELLQHELRSTVTWIRALRAQFTSTASSRSIAPRIARPS